MTAVCKTWAVAAKDFKPLCNNSFQATNNSNECDVCVGPTVYGPTDGIVLGQCGCSPTTGEIERSWVLKVEQGPLWSTLSATEQQLLSCFLGTFGLTNNTLAWYAANGLQLTYSYYTGYTDPGCVVNDSGAYTPPALYFLCEMLSYALQVAYLAGGTGNYCRTYPFKVGDTCLWPVPKFTMGLAGPTSTLNGKTYRGVEPWQRYGIVFVYGGRSGSFITQLPTGLCSFTVPGKLPACSTSEAFTYQLYGNAHLGDVDYWNKRFKVTLSGS
jgi:hypothetical protein